VRSICSVNEPASGPNYEDSLVRSRTLELSLMTINPRRTTFMISIGLLCFVFPGAPSEARQKSEPEPVSSTVPLHVQFNRPFIDLEFSRPDGSPRKARFWLDTGGGGFLFCEALARDIGMKFGEEVHEEGERFARTTPPRTMLGKMALNIDGARASIVLGKKTIQPGVEAEGLFPAHLLRRYHVIFDYPGGKFTLAKPGTLTPRGVRIATPVGQRSGFPRLEIQIAGQTFGFLLDTGASFTMISRVQIETWIKAQPEWPNAVGAAGAANMGLGKMEADGLMLGLPQVELGPFQLKAIAAISRPKGTYESYMSGMMTQPIIGAIGGNLLRAFRIEIDYANNATYFERTGSPDTDLVMIGLTVQPLEDGSYTVSGVVRQNGKALVDGVLAGDKLIKIDQLDVSGSSLARVVGALRGKIGTKRTLILERDGKRITVTAPIVRIL
jgi:Aspartyl protease